MLYQPHIKRLVARCRPATDLSSLAQLLCQNRSCNIPSMQTQLGCYLQHFHDLFRRPTIAEDVFHVQLQTRHVQMGGSGVKGAVDQLFDLPCC